MDLRFAPVAALLAASAFAANTDGVKPTFTKDVAPILDRRCVECHRSGEAAPMAFTSFKEVRPWAKAIRQAVVQRVMPPWYADPAHGEFKNDRRLAQTEIDTIVAWVNAGAPEGELKDLPALPAFAEGWNIGKPDQVFDFGLEFQIPASGVVEYQYFQVPTNFTEDKWIQAAEIRPQHRAAIHHINVYIAPPGKPINNSDIGPMLMGYAPGVQPLNLDEGTAVLVKAGSTFVFQAHFTPNGTAVKDRSFIGVKFAKTVPSLQSTTDRAFNYKFRIPPGDPNYEVKASWTATRDVELYAMMPHMHFRGKDFEYTVVYPDGRTEILLDVPHYDFNWQLGYELKKNIMLPKGTRIDCVAHFDNSPNNNSIPIPPRKSTGAIRLLKK